MGGSRGTVLTTTGAGVALDDGAALGTLESTGDGRGAGDRAGRGEAVDRAGEGIGAADLTVVGAAVGFAVVCPWEQAASVRAAAAANALP